MTEYRAYFIRLDGQIIRQTPLICTDDAEAIALAKQLAGGYVIELWNGGRLVTRLEAKTK
jgi:hypothetical protein